MDEKKTDSSTSIIIDIPQQDDKNETVNPQPQPQQHQRQRPNSILYKTCWAIERIAQRTIYKRPYVTGILLWCAYMLPEIYCDLICLESYKRVCVRNSIILQGVLLVLMAVKMSSTAYLNEVRRGEREEGIENGVSGDQGSGSGSTSAPASTSTSTLIEG